MADLTPPIPVSVAAPKLLQSRLKHFGFFGVVLTAAFVVPVSQLIRFAWHSDLHSYALLIPFVSAYLIWLRRDERPPSICRSTRWAVAAAALGIAAVSAAGVVMTSGTTLSLSDRLALSTFGYLCLLAAGAFFLLGAPLLRHFAFPSLLLLFVIPIPAAVEHSLEVFFQYASAEAAALLFGVSGTTVFRDGLMFKLPGITLQVAQECSGIRSTVVLFITSLIAGNMFLRSPWRRAALTVFVIPLAILRNGFRVFTIAMLCVHVDPAMVDSALHHRGGPIFFGLSLIPFAILLLLLRRRERTKTPVNEE